MVIAKWVGERDDERFQAALRDPSAVEQATERVLRGEALERDRGAGEQLEQERRPEVVLPR